MIPKISIRLGDNAQIYDSKLKWQEKKKHTVSEGKHGQSQNNDLHEIT